MGHCEPQNHDNHLRKERLLTTDRDLSPLPATPPLLPDSSTRKELRTAETAITRPHGNPLNSVLERGHPGGTLRAFEVQGQGSRRPAVCGGNPGQEIIVLCPTWFWTVPVDIHVGETPAYDHLSLESNSTLNKLFFT